MPLFLTSVSSSPSLITSSTETTTVTSSALSYNSFPANANRKGLTISNQSTGNLYIGFGGGAISSTSYHVKIPAAGYYEVPFNWTGIVGYESDIASGSVVFCEFT